MTTLHRSSMSLLNLFPVAPDSGYIPVSGNIHLQKHDLNSDADHLGVLPEDKIHFMSLGGHTHDGINSCKFNHSNLDGIGLNSHIEIDNHLGSQANPHMVTPFQIGAIEAQKPIAIPQTEQSDSSVTTTVYRVKAVAPIFVGRNIGINPNSVISLFEMDGTRLANNGLPITITKITSDASGDNSVVGFGYVTNPYIHLTAIPNKNIKLRYGIECVFERLPETVLLNEPMWVGETTADVRQWISEIKGMAYDTPVAPDKTLLELSNRIDIMERDIPPQALVFKDNIITSINNSEETSLISANKIANIPESCIIDQAILARIEADETITGQWKFTSGPVIESGEFLPTDNQAGRLFVKLDTKTLYIANGTEWHKSVAPPRHIRVIGDGVRQQWIIPDATAGNNSIWVYRNMLLQDIELGHYTETQDVRSVVVTFPSPIPRNVVIIFKVF